MKIGYFSTILGGVGGPSVVDFRMLEELSAIDHDNHYVVYGVTPEATRAVVERFAPGISEAIRADGLARTPRAALGRGIAGVRNSTLIVNLPGSPGGVSDGLQVLSVIVEHAVDLVRGRFTSHD